MKGVCILMFRIIGLIAVLLQISWASGCAMCHSPHDYSYAACGGTCCAERSGGGRVASAFDPVISPALSEIEVPPAADN